MKFRAIVTVAAAACLALSMAASAEAGCVRKGGNGWGLTKDIAKFQAFEIIEQSTGNWPVRTDKITQPVFTCKEDALGWHCKAFAKVCSK
jgi:hypothetical protein